MARSGSLSERPDAHANAPIASGCTLTRYERVRTGLRASTSMAIRGQPPSHSETSHHEVKRSQAWPWSERVARAASGHGCATQGERRRRKEQECAIVGMPLSHSFFQFFHANTRTHSARHANLTHGSTGCRAVYVTRTLVLRHNLARPSAPSSALTPALNHQQPQQANLHEGPKSPVHSQGKSKKSLGPD